MRRGDAAGLVIPQFQPNLSDGVSEMAIMRKALQVHSASAAELPVIQQVSPYTHDATSELSAFVVVVGASGIISGSEGVPTSLVVSVESEQGEAGAPIALDVSPGLVD